MSPCLSESVIFRAAARTSSFQGRDRHITRSGKPPCVARFKAAEKPSGGSCLAITWPSRTTRTRPSMSSCTSTFALARVARCVSAGTSITRSLRAPRCYRFRPFLRYLAQRRQPRSAGALSHSAVCSAASCANRALRRGTNEFSERIGLLDCRYPFEPHL